MITRTEWTLNSVAMFSMLFLLIYLVLCPGFISGQSSHQGQWIAQRSGSNLLLQGSQQSSYYSRHQNMSGVGRNDVETKLTDRLLLNNQFRNPVDTIATNGGQYTRKTINESHSDMVRLDLRSDRLPPSRIGNSRQTMSGRRLPNLLIPQKRLLGRTRGSNSRVDVNINTLPTSRRFELQNTDIGAHNLSQSRTPAAFNNILSSQPQNKRPNSVRQNILYSQVHRNHQRNSNIIQRGNQLHRRVLVRRRNNNRGIQRPLLPAPDTNSRYSRIPQRRLLPSVRNQRVGSRVNTLYTPGHHTLRGQRYNERPKLVRRLNDYDRSGVLIQRSSPIHMSQTTNIKRKNNLFPWSRGNNQFEAHDLNHNTNLSTTKAIAAETLNKVNTTIVLEAETERINSTSLLIPIASADIAYKDITSFKISVTPRNIIDAGLTVSRSTKGVKDPRKLQELKPSKTTTDRNMTQMNARRDHFIIENMLMSDPLKDIRKYNTGIQTPHQSNPRLSFKSNGWIWPNGDINKLDNLENLKPYSPMMESINTALGGTTPFIWPNTTYSPYRKFSRSDQATSNKLPGKAVILKIGSPPKETNPKKKHKSNRTQNKIKLRIGKKTNLLRPKKISDAKKDFQALNTNRTKITTTLKQPTKKENVLIAPQNTSAQSLHGNKTSPKDLTNLLSNQTALDPVSVNKSEILYRISQDSSVSFVEIDNTKELKQYATTNRTSDYSTTPSPTINRDLTTSQDDTKKLRKSSKASTKSELNFNLGVPLNEVSEDHQAHPIENNFHKMKTDSYFTENINWPEKLFSTPSRHVTRSWYTSKGGGGFSPHYNLNVETALTTLITTLLPTMQTTISPIQSRPRHNRLSDNSLPTTSNTMGNSSTSLNNVDMASKIVKYVPTASTHENSVINGNNGDKFTLKMENTTPPTVTTMENAEKYGDLPTSVSNESVSTTLPSILEANDIIPTSAKSTTNDQENLKTGSNYSDVSKFVVGKVTPTVLMQTKSLSVNKDYGVSANMKVSRANSILPTTPNTPNNLYNMMNSVILSTAVTREDISLSQHLPNNPIIRKYHHDIPNYFSWKRTFTTPHVPQISSTSRKHEDLSNPISGTTIIPKIFSITTNLKDSPISKISRVHQSTDIKLNNKDYSGSNNISTAVLTPEEQSTIRNYGGMPISNRTRENSVFTTPESYSNDKQAVTSIALPKPTLRTPTKETVGQSSIRNHTTHHSPDNLIYHNRVMPTNTSTTTSALPSSSRVLGTEAQSEITEITTMTTLRGHPADASANNVYSNQQGSSIIGNNSEKQGLTEILLSKLVLDEQSRPLNIHSAKTTIEPKLGGQTVSSLSPTTDISENYTTNVVTSTPLQIDNLSADKHKNHHSSDVNITKPDANSQWTPALNVLNNIASSTPMINFTTPYVLGLKHSHEEHFKPTVKTMKGFVTAESLTGDLLAIETNKKSISNEPSMNSSNVKTASITVVPVHPSNQIESPLAASKLKKHSMEVSKYGYPDTVSSPERPPNMSSESLTFRKQTDISNTLLTQEMPTFTTTTIKPPISIATKSASSLVKRISSVLQSSTDIPTVLITTTKSMTNDRITTKRNSLIHRNRFFRNPFLHPVVQNPFLTSLAEANSVFSRKEPQKHSIEKEMLKPKTFPVKKKFLPKIHNPFIQSNIIASETVGFKSQRQHDSNLGIDKVFPVRRTDKTLWATQQTITGIPITQPLSIPVKSSKKEQEFANHGALSKTKHISWSPQITPSIRPATQIPTVQNAKQTSTMKPMGLPRTETKQSSDLILLEVLKKVVNSEGKTGQSPVIEAAFIKTAKTNILKYLLAKVSPSKLPTVPPTRLPTTTPTSRAVDTTVKSTALHDYHIQEGEYREFTRKKLLPTNIPPTGELDEYYYYYY